MRHDEKSLCRFFCLAVLADKAVIIIACLPYAGDVQAKNIATPSEENREIENCYVLLADRACSDPPAAPGAIRTRRLRGDPD